MIHKQNIQRNFDTISKIGGVISHNNRAPMRTTVGCKLGQETRLNTVAEITIHRQTKCIIIPIEAIKTGSRTIIPTNDTTHRNQCILIECTQRHYPKRKSKLKEILIRWHKKTGKKIKKVRHLQVDTLIYYMKLTKIWHNKMMAIYDNGNTINIEMATDPDEIYICKKHEKDKLIRAGNDTYNNIKYNQSIYLRLAKGKIIGNCNCKVAKNNDEKVANNSEMKTYKVQAIVITISAARDRARETKRLHQYTNTMMLTQKAHAPKEKNTKRVKRVKTLNKKTNKHTHKKEEKITRSKNNQTLRVKKEQAEIILSQQEARRQATRDARTTKAAREKRRHAHKKGRISASTLTRINRCMIIKIVSTRPLVSKHIYEELNHIKKDKTKDTPGFTVKSKIKSNNIQAHYIMDRDKQRIMEWQPKMIKIIRGAKRLIKVTKRNEIIKYRIRLNLIEHHSEKLTIIEHTKECIEHLTEIMRRAWVILSRLEKAKIIWINNKEYQYQYQGPKITTGKECYNYNKQIEKEAWIDNIWHINKKCSTILKLKDPIFTIEKNTDINSTIETWIFNTAPIDYYAKINKIKNTTRRILKSMLKITNIKYSIKHRALENITYNNNTNDNNTNPSINPIIIMNKTKATYKNYIILNRLNNNSTLNRYNHIHTSKNKTEMIHIDNMVKKNLNLYTKVCMRSKIKYYNTGKQKLKTHQENVIDLVFGGRPNEMPTIAHKPTSAFSKTTECTHANKTSNNEDEGKNNDNNNDDKYDNDDNNIRINLSFKQESGFKKDRKMTRQKFRLVIIKQYFKTNTWRRISRHNWKRLEQSATHHGNTEHNNNTLVNRTLMVLDTRGQKKLIRELYKEMEKEEIDIAILFRLPNDLNGILPSTWQKKHWRIYKTDDKSTVIILNEMIKAKQNRHGIILETKKGETLLNTAYLPANKEEDKSTKSNHQITDRTLKRTKRRINKYENTIVICQTNNKNSRWNENGNSQEYITRANMIDNWETSIEGLKLIKKQHENIYTRIISKNTTKWTTYEAGWKRNVRTTKWENHKIPNIESQRGLKCTIKLGQEETNITSDTINNETNEATQIYQIDRIERGLLKVIQATVLDTVTGMQRTMDIAKKKEADIIILIKPRLETLNEWKDTWDMAISENGKTAIVILNNHLIWTEVSSTDRYLGAAIDIGSENKLRIRTLYLPGSNKKETTNVRRETIIKTLKATREADIDIDHKIIVGDVSLNHTKWAPNAKHFELNLGTLILETIDDLGMRTITEDIDIPDNNHNTLFATEGINIENWRIIDKVLRYSKATEFNIHEYKEEQEYISQNNDRKAWNKTIEDQIREKEEEWEDYHIRELQAENVDEKKANIKVLQVNMRKCRATQSELLQYIVSNAIDIIIISEPAIYPGNKLNIPGRLIRGVTGKDGRYSIAIVIVNKNISIIDRQDCKEKEFCSITIGREDERISIIALYNRPTNKSLTEFGLTQRVKELDIMLDKLEEAMEKLPNETIIIAGDFNIKSPEWNMSRNSPKKIIESFKRFTLERGLKLINTKPYAITCENINKQGGSTIDLTFSNNTKSITNWRIHDDITNSNTSDHKYIRWDIKPKASFKADKRKPRYTINTEEEATILQRKLATAYTQIIEQMNTDHWFLKEHIDQKVRDLTIAIQTAMTETKKEEKDRIENDKDKTKNRNDRKRRIITSENRRARKKRRKTNLIRKRRKKNAKFWNQSLYKLKIRHNKMKHEYKQLIRESKREINDDNREEIQELIKTELQELRKTERELKDAIQNTRTEQFKEACEIDHVKNAFSQAYKIVMERTIPESALTNMTTPTGEELTKQKEIMEHMLDINFPNDNEKEDTPEQKSRRYIIDTKEESDYYKMNGGNIYKDTLESDEPERTEMIEITQNSDEMELGFNMKAPGKETFLEAIRKAANKKAPGEDGITAEVIKIEKEKLAEILARIMEKCLDIGYFPQDWKQANVVMIPKPGKNQQTAKGWRPICLLKVLAKIMDKVMIEGIMEHVKNVGQYNPNQYGFTQSKSTVHAIWDATKTIKEKKESHGLVACLFLDIGGAFDNAWHISLKEKLRKSKCPRNWYFLISNYLKEREIIYSRDGETIRKRTNRGTPQGSSSGPSIWNLVYDDMLELNKEFEDARFQAYADDALIITWAENKKDLKKKCKALLKRVFEWGKANKLKFCPEKTELLIAFDKQKKPKKETFKQFNELIIKTEGQEIKNSSLVRYLGVFIDEQMTYKAHAKIAMERSRNAMNKLIHIARKDYGLTPGILRIVYKVTVETIMSYGCAIWQEDVLNDVRMKRTLLQWNREVAQKVARSMGTIAREDAAFLANILPIEFRLEELASTWKLKNLAYYSVINEGGTLLSRLGYNKRIKYTDINDIDANIIIENNISPQDIEKCEGAWVITASEEEDGNNIQVMKNINNNETGQRHTRLYEKQEDIMYISRTSKEEMVADAIHEVIDMAREERLKATDKINIEIVTDVKEIANEDEKSARSIITSAINKARDWRITIRIFILKDTSENKAMMESLINEAKEDIRNEHFEKVRTPESNKRLIEQTYYDIWQRDWIRLDTSAHSRFLIGSVYERNQTKHIKSTYEMAQIYSGQSKLADHQNKLKHGQGSSICQGCNKEDETIPHFLFNCEVWKDYREGLEEWLEANKDQWETEEVIPDIEIKHPEADEIIDRIEGKYKEINKPIPTREYKELDRTLGITAEAKHNRYKKEVSMRKLRAMVRDKKGHEELEKYVKNTERLHLHTIGIDKRKKKSKQYRKHKKVDKGLSEKLRSNIHPQFTQSQNTQHQDTQPQDTQLQDTQPQDIQLQDKQTQDTQSQHTTSTQDTMNTSQAKSFNKWKAWKKNRDRYKKAAIIRDDNQNVMEPKQPQNPSINKINNAEKEEFNMMEINKESFRQSNIRLKITKNNNKAKKFDPNKPTPKSPGGRTPNIRGENEYFAMFGLEPRE